MSLLTRFPLRLSIPVFLFLLVLMVEGYVLVSSQRLADIEEENKAIALINRDMSQLQVDVGHAMRRGNEEKILADIARDGANPNVMAEMLIDDAGRIIAATDLTLIGEPIGRALPAAEMRLVEETTRTLAGSVRVAEDRQSITAYFPVTLGARPGEIRPRRVGVLFLRYDLASAKAARRHVLERQVLLSTAFFAGCFLLLGLVLHLMITRRLHDLALAAGQLAAGDLSARAGMSGRDELAQIGNGFDRLAGEIAASQHALQRLNRELSAIRSCNQALVRAEEEQPLLDEVCRIICDEAGYRGAWVGFAEHDGAKRIHPVAWSGFEPGYLERAALTWADTAHGRGPSGTAIREGASVYVQDIATDPCVAPWREGALQRGYRSTVALPLKDSAGHAFGVLSIYASEPHAFTKDEVVLLEELAGDLAYGIAALRTRAAKRQAEGALQEERRLFISGPNVAFKWRAAEGWPVEYVSPNIVNWFGYHPNDLTSGKISYADIMHPDDRERVQQEVMAYTERQIPYYDQEYRIARADGEYRWVYDFTVVVRDASRRVTHYNGYIMDITERKRIEDERAQLLVREQAARAEVAVAQDLAQLKNAFINAVSHDLRNPLTTIKGYAEFFEDEVGGPVTEQQRDYIAQILKGTKRLEFLVNDLLDAARSEAGTFLLHLEQTDFRAKVQEVIESLGPQAQEAGISLESDLSPDALSLMVDPERIERVLVNLLANAIKFTPPGGRIRVRARLEGDWLRCEVEDLGVGIAPEDLSKLFKPFSQLEAGKKEKGGTGLGLSISKTIVEKHGGSIGARSEVGVGSTFWFTLPLRRPSAGA